MKSSLVLELQRRALDDKASVSSVLLMALAVARKLRVPSIDQWLHHEIDGYPADVELPKYRSVHGTIMADTRPYGGSLVPVVYQDRAEAERLQVAPIRQPVAEIEKHVADHQQLRTDWGTTVHGSRRLMVYLVLESAAFVGILERIRKMVLEWSLELEAQQVLGEGMSFSAEEIERAKTVSTTNVFFGDVGQAFFQQGHAQDFSIVHGADLAEVQALVESVASARDDLTLDGEQRRRLDEALALIEEETKKPEPKKSRVRGAIETLGELAKVGKAGTEIATAIAKIIAMFS